MLDAQILQVAESSFYSLLTCLLLVVSILPLGFWTISFLKLKTPHLKLAAALAFGGLLIAAFMSSIYGASKLGVPLEFSRIVFLGILVLAFVWSVRTRAWLSIKHSDIFTGLIILIPYILLCVISTLFPGGRIEEASVDTTMFYSGLPVDLLIPFNVSRYLLEGLSPNSLEVVPGWGASDRGPLLGLLSAFFFLIAGIGETKSWLGTSYGPFFFYQVIAIFFNALSLLGVWLFSCRYFGRTAASYSCLTLVTTYFYFLNVFFAWPKFYMAFLFLTSLWLWSAEKKWLAAGILAGGATLAHDSGVFVVAAFLVFTALKFLFSRGNTFFGRISLSIKPIATYIFGLSLLYVPWSLLKALWVKPSPRLFYMHLFCYKGESLEGHTFSSLLQDYLNTNSIADIAGIRLSNLLYPINPMQAIGVWEQTGGRFFAFLNNISYLVFFQTYLAAGVIITGLFIYSLCRSLKVKNERMLLEYSAITVGSVFFLVLISGCEGNVVNHIWVYPVFLVGALCVGNLVSKTGLFIRLLFSLGVAFNLFLTYFYMYYRPVLKPFLHAENVYLYSQAALGCMVLFLLFIFSYQKNEEVISSD